jgi:hypothetical protein
MPKTTIAAACRDRGIDRKVWDEAKRQGVDPWDRKAMEAWMKSRRHRIKPGTKLAQEVATAQTLEQMEHAIRSATNIDDVKILKEKVLALKGIVAVQTDTRELVPVGEVRQSMTRVCSAARGELMKLTSDLPPRLEGLPASSMSKIIKAEIIAILTRLSDETSALYAD